MWLCLQGALCDDAVLEETGWELERKRGPCGLCVGRGHERSGNGSEEKSLCHGQFGDEMRDSIVAWVGRMWCDLGVWVEGRMCPGKDIRLNESAPCPWDSPSPFLHPPHPQPHPVLSTVGSQACPWQETGEFSGGHYLHQRKDLQKLAVGSLGGKSPMCHAIIPQRCLPPQPTPPLRTEPP